MATSWLNFIQDADSIHLHSPYNPRATEIFKLMKARWSGKEKLWTFARIQREQIARYCVEIFGHDPWTEPDLVDVIVDLSNEMIAESSLYLMGRCVLKRWTLDSAVSCGELVSFVEGTFPAIDSTGIIGQADNPCRIRIHEVPRTALVLMPDIKFEVIAYTPTLVKPKKKGRVSKDLPRSFPTLSKVDKVIILPADEIKGILNSLKPSIKQMSDKEKEEVFKLLFED